jgi:hypothetical protein
MKKMKVSLTVISNTVVRFLIIFLKILSVVFIYVTFGY